MKPRLGGDFDSSLDLLRSLILLLPHCNLLAASLAEIKEAGRAMGEDNRTKEELRTLQQALVAFFDLAYRAKIVPSHPIRGIGGSDARVTGEQISLLAAAISDQQFAKLGCSLPNSNILMDRAATGSITREMIRWFPFDIIVASYPFADEPIPLFLMALRDPSCPSRNAALMHITPAAMVEEARTVVGGGPNRVLLDSAPLEEIRSTIHQLLSVTPRMALRVLVRVSLKKERRKGPLLWQSENISTTGMLLRGAQPPVGTLIGFEFTVPGNDRPIRGTAEVARHTVRGRDHIVGVAVRFTDFAAGSKLQLETFLTAQGA